MHHNFDDSDSGYDVDMDSKSKQFGANQNQRGRIILLGDGSEVLTDSDDAEMFDRGDEDRDLASQVTKNPTPDKITEPDMKGVADAVLPKAASKEEK